MEVDLYGLGRVVGEPGVLPQQAKRLDPGLPLRPGEVLIDVEALNVDAASFRQLKQDAGGDAVRIGEAIERIVRERGKLQNPVTGSGGMLIGRVREVAPGHPGRPPLVMGQRVATLVSLTLTPLRIDAVRAVVVESERVEIQGQAILFATGLYAVLPEDIPDHLALAVLDVCGAPAQVARLAAPGMRILVLGAGKSGAMCLAEARRRQGGNGQLIALDISRPALSALKQLGLCDAVLEQDATRAVDVLEAVRRETGGALCDLVINCASVPHTEMATLLCTRDRGTALFFSMATSFTAAALGAEGVGKDVTLLIGNGYVQGHAELALSLLRESPGLRQHLEARR